MSVALWKEAQNRVSKEFNKYTSQRKTAVFRSFADTYAAGGNIIQAQPSDYWLLADSIFYILEVKSCHQARFPLKDVRPGQWAHARMIPPAGGRSLFLIAKLPEWQWHFMTGQRMLVYKDMGASSILWNEMSPIQLDASLIITLGA